jgi:hypothetical protein
MSDAEPRLEQEVAELLRQAEAVDAAEDAQYGRGQRGDDLPAELARRDSRLARIRAAKAVLEQQARDAAAQQAVAAQAKRAAREQRVGSAKGKPATVPDPAQAQPAPTAQYNFTDPDSRIMKDGATHSFVQAYNAQAAVDGQAQVIVACAVTQAAPDVGQLVPVLEQVETNVGQAPAVVTADAGYFSEANLTAPAVATVALYVPPDRQKHDRPTDAATAQRHRPLAEAMRATLRTPAGRVVYARRKAIVEPVFGQIKAVRGFRRFLLRGVRQATGEWALICLTHNLLKLFRAPARLQPA